MGTGAPARPGRAKPGSPSLTIPDVAAAFRQIANARGPAAKSALVRELLTQATPLEAKYIIKIMTGDLRIGLKESLVEEAIAKAYGGTLKEVQRANMLLGDIGETLKLAVAGKLNEAKMRLFHPLGFMLASPAESAEQALSYFENALVEDKYDGIRAQAHCSDGEVRIFSRTRDDITESFPELPDALAGLPQDAILDGEIVAWSYPSPSEVAPASRRLSGGRPAHRAESTAEAADSSPAKLSPSAPCSNAWEENKSARSCDVKCRSPISSSMSSMPAASCCWSAPCASARRFSIACWRLQGNLELRDARQ